jgi:hypothetical protein
MRTNVGKTKKIPNRAIEISTANNNNNKRKKPEK